MSDWRIRPVCSKCGKTLRWGTQGYFDGRTAFTGIAIEPHKCDVKVLAEPCMGGSGVVVEELRGLLKGEASWTGWPDEAVIAALAKYKAAS